MKTSTKVYICLHCFSIPFW